MGMGQYKPQITKERINQIQQMIEANPGWSRTKLSKELCALWEWQSPYGQIKDISARDLLRSLDKKGLISLPAARWTPRAPGAGGERIPLIKHELAPVTAKLETVRPIQSEIVSTKDEADLFKSYIRQYHYLGFDRSVGENMKYFVYGDGGKILSCVMFGSAAWSCRARDEYIGWGKEQKTAGLARITNNVRFLILPTVRVPYLASHILGLIARRISRDWQAKYGHPLHLLETFVERDRFRGVCYQAANWRYVGVTRGKGRNSARGSAALPIKDVYLLPLRRDFRAKLVQQEANPNV
jgi:hypothetical protein